METVESVPSTVTVSPAMAAATSQFVAPGDGSPQMFVNQSQPAPATPVVGAQPQPSTPQQPRREISIYPPEAPAMQPQIAQPETQVGTEPPPHMIPKSRFDEVNGARRELEGRTRELEMQLAQAAGMLQALQSNQQQVQQQTQAPQDPNPLPQGYQSAEEFLIRDPAGFNNWVRQGAVAEAKAMMDAERVKLNQQVTKVSWKNDDLVAKQQYGAEYVEQVKAAVSKNPQLAQHFSKFENPYTRAAQYFRDQQVKQAIPNGDINAAKAAWAQEFLSNPTLLAQYAPHLVARPQAAPTAIPPPLAGHQRQGMPAQSMHASGISAVDAFFNNRDQRR